MKKIIKNIILEFQKEALPQMFQRDIEIPKLPKNIRKALVFIGMRRVGKTFLMFQHMKKALEKGLEKEKLVYINFEDDRLSSFTVRDFQMLLDIYFEMYPSYTKADDLIFYFDEIQNIDGWEKFIRRLIDKERIEIYITGSSAKSLSKEIATSLRGRCLENEVFPLSFKEYLKYKKIKKFNNLTNKEKSIIKHHSENYLKRGGFPESLDLSDSLHKKMIQSYVNAAVFRDVIDRYELKNPHIVKLFVLHCLQNIASPLSITKVYKTFKSRGESLSRNLLYDYLDYFEDSYLLCSVPIFELSTRKRQVNPSKIYCVDTGIINAYSIKPQTEYSSCLENAAYMHLRRLNFANIFYYKTKSGKEIDFVAQKENAAISLYQVCVNLSNENTRKREVSAIAEAAKEFKLKKAYIITSDESEIIKIGNITINVIPYWQWALKDLSDS